MTVPFILKICIPTLFFSTFWYLYLHKKTRVRISYIFKDNIVVFLASTLCMLLVTNHLYFTVDLIWYIFIPIFVFGFSFILTMYRFWRTPKRKIFAKENELVSPADGNVIYVNKLESGDIPVIIKKGLKACLNEITNSDIINDPSWLIGINMTPFDVHKNCVPTSGKVIINKHIEGKFLSLKEPTALIRNERNTLIIKSDDDEFFGVVQTASKLVKRIDTYVHIGQNLDKGQWFGMIRFGSQIDLIIPESYKVNIEIGQQVYAKKTIIAYK